MDSFIGVYFTSPVTRVSLYSQFISMVYTFFLPFPPPSLGTVVYTSVLTGYHYFLEHLILFRVNPSLYHCCNSPFLDLSTLLSSFLQRTSSLVLLFCFLWKKLSDFYKLASILTQHHFCDALLIKIVTWGSIAPSIQWKK